MADKYRNHPALPIFLFCKEKHLRNLKQFKLNARPRKMKPPKHPRPKLLSANAIARRLNRSPQGVLDAIKRLGISPEVTLPNGNYFAESAVKMIEGGMRRHNSGATKEA
jgi:hypothetical protein